MKQQQQIVQHLLVHVLVLVGYVVLLKQIIVFITAGISAVYLSTSVSTPITGNGVASRYVGSTLLMINITPDIVDLSKTVVSLYPTNFGYFQGPSGPIPHSQ
eukprot:UN08185